MEQIGAREVNENEGQREHGVSEEFRSHKTFIWHPGLILLHTELERGAKRWDTVSPMIQVQGFLFICPGNREMCISASERSWTKIKQNMMILSYISVCLFVVQRIMNWNIVRSEICTELCSKTQFPLYVPSLLSYSLSLLPSSPPPSPHTWQSKCCDPSRDYVSVLHFCTPTPQMPLKAHTKRSSLKLQIPRSKTDYNKNLLLQKRCAHFSTSIFH